MQGGLSFSFWSQGWTNQILPASLCIIQSSPSLCCWSSDDFLQCSKIFLAPRSPEFHGALQMHSQREESAKRSSIKLLAMLWFIQPATQLVFFAARAHWPLMFYFLPSWSPGPSVHRCFPAGLLGVIIQQVSGSAQYLNDISQILWHLHLFLMDLWKSKFTGRDKKKNVISVSFSRVDANYSLQNW